MKKRVFFVLMFVLAFGIIGCDFWGPSNPFSTATTQTIQVSTTTNSTTTTTPYTTTTMETMTTTGPTWITTTSNDSLPYSIAFFDVGGDLIWNGEFHEGDPIYETGIIPDIVLSFPGWDTEIPYNMPASNIELHAVYSFDLVVSGEGSVWMSNTEKEVVVIPSEYNGVTVERIQLYAFVQYEMENLIRTISIPNSVCQIDEYAFGGDLPNLNEILVDDSNPCFTSVNGVLYDKNMTTLYKYPSAKPDTEYTIPSSVILVMEYAFRGANQLERIHPSENLSIIKEGAFSYMQGLREITFPSTLLSFGNGILAGDIGLEEITIPFIGQSVDTPGGLDQLFSVDYSLDEVYSLREIHLTASKRVCLDGFTYFPNVTTITLNEGVDQITSIRNFESLLSIELPLTVVSIDGYAFSGDSSITSFVIPDSVMTIGPGIFTGIPELAYLSLPFIGSCRDTQISSQDTLGFLFDYVIPFSLVEIHITNQPTLSSLNFSDATSIQTIYIGEYTTSIWIPSFSELTHLESIVVSENNPNYTSVDGVLYDKSQEILIAYPSNKATEEYTLPSTVLEISAYAFFEAVKLKHIYLNDSLIQIGDFAFYNAISLEEIAIKAAVARIGVEAFQGTDSLQEIDVEPGNLNFSSIDGVLFNLAMNNLIKYPSAKINTEYVIPNSVYSIRTHAFYNTTNLLSISLQDHVRITSSEWLVGASNLLNIYVTPGNNYHASVDGVLFSKDLTEIWKFPEGRMEVSYTIPDGVESIYFDCFANLPILETLVIPSSVSYIDSEAFVNSTALSVIVVSPDSNFYVVQDGVLFTLDFSELVLYPEGLQNHDYVIPSSVTKILTNAFYGNVNLTSISIPISVEEIEFYAFSHLNSCTIYVEATSLPSLWNLNWNGDQVDVEWGAQIPE